MEKMSKLDMWMHFLCRDDEEKLQYAIEHNPAIKEAEEKYQKLLQDPDVLEECIINEFMKINNNNYNVSSVFVIADTHFNHKNIIAYCNRPFENVTEMNEYIINKWNGVVNKNDLVIHLGDFGFGSEENLKEINARLNGYKILIKGNHDYKRSNYSWHRIGFGSVQDKECEFNKFIFSHYPIEVPEDYYNIFGHIHNKQLEPNFSKGNHICVSCENIDYTPVRLKDVLKIKTN